jgi:hypothetical protein
MFILQAILPFIAGHLTTERLSYLGSTWRKKNVLNYVAVTVLGTLQDSLLDLFVKKMFFSRL